MPTSGNNSFEGGTSGTLVTAPASGGASGTAFDAIFGTALFWLAAAAFQGTMGASVAAGQFGAGQWTISSTKASLKMFFKPLAQPTADTYLQRIETSGGVRLFSVHATAAGKLRIDDASGTAGGFGNFTTVLDPTKYYRLESYVVAGSTTANGSAKVGLYLGLSTTPVETIFQNNAANIGAGQTMGKIIEGKANTGPEGWYFDGIAFDTTLSDFIGIPAASPPTVSTPAIQNTSAGAAVSVSVTASSSSGTIASYAWSYLYPSSGGPTLTGASTNTVGFTAGVAGKLYQLQCVVTDSNGLTTTVTTEVRVPSAGDITTLPGSPIANVGTWSNIGGAATPGDASADGLDTTYLESPNMSASEVSIRQRLAPSTARSVAQYVVKLSEDTVGASTIKVRLYEGTTLRQTWTQAVTTTLTPYPFDVTTPAAITDWGNLALEFAGTAP